MADGYAAAVHRLCAAPAHAGDLPPGDGPVRESEAAAPERGAWVRFSARLRDGVVAEARFRAWGCPHVLAACELAAARLPGQVPGRFEGVSAASLAEALDAPPEKRGRLLVVEDALAGLAAAAPASK